MYLLEEEQELFNDGIVLTADKLTPSKVNVNYDEDCKFSSDLYATTDPNDEEVGYLHFRLFDGESEDFDPALSYENKKISEVTLKFEQEGEEEDDSRFIFHTNGGAKIIFFNGDTKEIQTPSQLNGLSLILASKIFFVDTIRLLLNLDNSNYSL